MSDAEAEFARAKEIVRVGTALTGLFPIDTDFFYLL
jgi:hypothetical protein